MKVQFPIVKATRSGTKAPQVLTSVVLNKQTFQ